MDKQLDEVALKAFRLSPMYFDGLVKKAEHELRENRAIFRSYFKRAPNKARSMTSFGPPIRPVIDANSRANPITYH